MILELVDKIVGDTFSSAFSNGYESGKSSLFSQKCFLFSNFR